MEKLERRFWFSYKQDEEEEEAGYALKVKNILRWGKNLKSITSLNCMYVAKCNNYRHSVERVDDRLTGLRSCDEWADRKWSTIFCRSNADPKRRLCICCTVHDGWNLSCSESNSPSSYRSPRPVKNLADLPNRTTVQVGRQR